MNYMEKKTMKKIELDFSTVSSKSFWQLLLGDVEIRLSEYAMDRINAAREFVDALGDNQIPTYGINTGFGEMITTLVPSKFAEQLQKNLIRTHATGAGQLLDTLTIRAIMLCRLVTFSKGYSGISLEIVQVLLNYINNDIYPIVHAQGSLGASGDLSPLAEIARGLSGEGYFTSAKRKKLVDHFADNYHEILIDFKGVDFDQDIVTHTKWLPIKSLGYKEGLSLINGTAGMTGISLINHKLTAGLIRFALVATAFCLNALEASDMPFDSTGTMLKGHEHNNTVSFIIRKLIEQSKLIRHQDSITNRLRSQIDSESVTHADEFLQNAYSLRAIPQIIGPVIAILDFYNKTILCELNGIDDNPVIIPNSSDYYVFHGANFHGQAIGFANDYLKIAITQLANLSNRRVVRLIDSKYSGSLPDLLVTDDQGLNCGFEGLEYTSGSIVAEMRANTNPNSIQNVPSNLNNQDIVSMGMIAARKCQDNILNAFSVIAVELIIALQAVDLRLNLKFDWNIPKNKTSVAFDFYLGKPLAEIYYWIREGLSIKTMNEDRYVGDDLQKLIKEMITTSLSNSSAFKIFTYPL